MNVSEKSAERTIIDRSSEGVRVHDMTGGWRVVVAKHGEHHATWYFHVNDDVRIAAALEREANRRLVMWQAAAARAALSTTSKEG